MSQYAYPSSTPSVNPIIWKWNETDATEFTAYLDEIGGGTPVTLSKVAGADGPRLRITWSGAKVTGEKLTVIGINALSLPVVLTDVRRYRLKFRIVGFGQTGAAARTEFYAIGASILCNKASGASHYSQFVMANWGVASRFGKVTAGVVALSGATPNWTTQLSNIVATNDNQLVVPFDVSIQQKHPVASLPTWRGQPYADSPPNTNATKMYGCASGAFLAADVGALAGGWSTETLATCGIAILGNTGTTAGHYFEIDQITVERLPMDM